MVVLGRHSYMYVFVVGGLGDCKHMATASTHVVVGYEGDLIAGYKVTQKTIRGQGWMRLILEDVPCYNCNV